MWRQGGAHLLQTQEGGKKMRKGPMMVALVALLVAIFATAAYAATIEGDNSDDELFETPRSDSMYGFGGEDVLEAWDFRGDTDNLYGGRGNDDVIADDGDGRDLLDGGRGRNDYCEGDRGDSFRNCDGNFVRR
jgi:hypothetical protein